MVNPTVIISLLLIFIGYILFSQKLWIILIIALPMLALGQFLHFEIRPSWIYEISLSEVLLILSAAILLVTAIYNRSFLKIKIDRIFFLLLIYLVIGIISFYSIDNVRLFVSELKVIVFSLLAYWLSINLIDTVPKIKKLVYGLAFLVFVLSMQIFWEILQLGFSSRLFLDRSSVVIPIGAIALVSAVLSLILPLLLAFYFSMPRENKNRVFILISFLLGLIAILLIMAKAAIISLLIALIYLFIKIKQKRLALALVFGAFMVISSLVFAPYMSGLVDRVANVSVDKNTQFRKQEYQIGWKIISQHKWFGVGIGQQPLYYQKEFGFEYRNLVNNFLMQSLIDLGLFGLLVISLIIKKIIFIGKSFNKSFILKNPIYYGFIASLLAAMVNGLFFG
ncbi:MAG: hypothetical protein US81_C0034G0003 [Parcubacteria group bacterium GW2011_GWE2_38_18]|nr:MAG: hypothetical protein US81_C0034G0003 [Parcubacteria group bacterium GW2011_GWE2_38_18]